MPRSKKPFKVPKVDRSNPNRNPLAVSTVRYLKGGKTVWAPEKPKPQASKKGRNQDYWNPKMEPAPSIRPDKWNYLHREVTRPGYAPQPKKEENPWLPWDLQKKPVDEMTERERERYDDALKKKEQSEKDIADQKRRADEHAEQVRRAVNSEQSRKWLREIEQLHNDPKFAPLFIDVGTIGKKRESRNAGLVTTALKKAKDAAETEKLSGTRENVVAGIENCLHHVAVLDYFSEYFQKTGSDATMLPERQRSIFYTHFNALPGRYKFLTNDLGTLKRFNNSGGAFQTPVSAIEEHIKRFKSDGGIYKRHDRNFNQMVDSAKRRA